MYRFFIYNLSILLSLYANSSVFAGTAEPLSAHKNYTAIGEYIQYLQEKDRALTLDEARHAYISNQFTPWNKPVVSIAIGTAPVWLRFTIINDGTNTIHRRLIIENSWLDLAHIHIIKDGNIIHQQKAGDSLPYKQRAVDHRFLIFDFEYTPGLYEVYIYTQTPDPMVLPIFFGDLESSHERDVFNGYSYGLLYGLIIGLLLYNLSLYISIKQKRYFYYVLYLLSFLIMNFSYTGHAYNTFWPDSVFTQKWLNPISISIFSTTGIMFGFSFLNVRKLLPRIYSRTIILCAIFWALQLSLVLFNLQTLSVMLAIAFVMFFSVFTFYCAIICFNQGHKDAMYYIIATVATMIGAAITSLSVLAIIPYTTLSYRAAEITISIDALLLSIALAMQFRRAQEDKLEAQQLARIDMLTSLNNRRAFNELSSPLWHNSIRHEHETCVILLDLDEFKSINDKYGHAAGDDVLKEISGVLNTIVREGDVLARWGGEEFIIMLPQTSLYQATKTAERIREIISKLTIKTKLHNITVSASLGIAQSSHNTKKLDHLIQLADKGLYQAKNSGRNKICANQDIID